jgi:hypothetical protein
LDKLNSKADKLREQWNKVGTTNGPKTVFDLVERIDAMVTESTEGDDDFESLNRTKECYNKPPWNYNKCMKIDC